MLKELHLAQDDSSNTSKHWFQDEYFDLFVWENQKTKEIICFQLCYDRLGKERVFSWDQERGFGHHQIDNGEYSPHKNMSPVFVRGGNFSYAEVLPKFTQASEQINSKISQFITQKLLEYQPKQVSKK